MRSVFRVDASDVMGVGHIMRCLCLADAIRSHGGGAEFICRPHEGHLARYVASKGFEVHLLPQVRMGDHYGGQHASWLGSSWVEDAYSVASVLADRPRFDWLVVDHYAIDVRWERLLRSAVGRILVIDDLADRRHDCDLLLDQNIQPACNNRYVDLAPSTCRFLLGPGYALLRSEFRDAREGVRVHSGPVRRLHVYFGGADVEDLTTRTLGVLAGLGLSDIAVDVFVGPSNTRASSVTEFCERLGFNVYGHRETIADALVRADLAIGAAGSSVWERCALGLPAVTLGGAANQSLLGMLAEREGVCVYLGSARDVSDERLAAEVADLLIDDRRRVEMARKGLQLVDCLGVARVLSEMQRAGIV